MHITHFDLQLLALLFFVSLPNVRHVLRAFTKKDRRRTTGKRKNASKWIRPIASWHQIGMHK